MAAGSKRGGDMVLGGRHLVGIFFLLVVILGLVFTLGYLLGRSQYDTQLRAAASGIVENTSQRPPAHAPNPPRSSPNKDADKSVIPVRGKDYVAPGASGPPTSDWDFYHVAEPPKPVEKLSPAPKPARQSPGASDRALAPAVPAKSARSSKVLNAPLVPRGAIVLQVAALVRESDALSMAQALQQKKFPAFVLSPESDNFYRVQVGPYKDAAAANTARQRLQDQGFKSIVKR